MAAPTTTSSAKSGGVSAGLAVNVSYTWQRQYQILTSANANGGALGPGSNFEIHQPEFNLQAQGVPHAFKMLWTYDIPYGRGKRYGANIDPWLDYIIGNWTFAGTGRVQVQDFVLRNAKLVGMSQDEAQAALKEVRFVTDPSGVTSVWNFPQDIIDNTRKAYNTDETSQTFYGAGQEPTGRYFAPASGPGCNFLYPGDCDRATCGSRAGGSVSSTSVSPRWFRCRPRPASRSALRCSMP